MVPNMSLTGCLAAMNIAACAGAKPYAPRNAANTV